MKKTVLIFGLIAGLIVTGMMFYSTYKMKVTGDMKDSMVMGYATMIIAFSFIFVGIRNYRNKYCGGYISFGKAFKVGALITLIAGTMYVGVWLIEYYFFFPDFIDVYSQCVIKNAQAEGATAAVINDKQNELATMKEWYGNPLFVILLTYLEIIPVGLIIALISALILKKKKRIADTAFAQ